METLKFEAYGYEVTIQPHFEEGQWLAEVDGLCHSFEDWQVYPDEHEAVMQSLLWCRAHAHETCRGTKECSCEHMTAPPCDHENAVPF